MGGTRAGAGTKRRIEEATAELFRRRGYTATGMKQIAAEARAPFGSVYHFFPGGKEQLAREVLRDAGRGYMELVTAVIDAAPDLPTGVGAAFEGAALLLEGTDYGDACPIGTVALEVAGTHEPLRLVTAEVFAGWTGALASRLTAAGASPGAARSAALSVIALLEGAFMLSRAAKDTEAVRAAGAVAAATVRTALEN